MPLPHLVRKLPGPCWCLWGWAVACGIWAVTARKPWQTLAFATGVPVKHTPRDDFMAAGLWVGLLASGLIAVLIASTHRFWGGSEAAPVAAAPAPRQPFRISPWFQLVLGGWLGLVLWRCWPAMGLSFWGDEATMFADFVHGRWLPATKGGSLQGELTFKAVPWKHAFFCDYYGANHWLATHLQRLVLQAWQAMGGRPVWAFEEWVVRLVPMSAGLATLIALASWLRWMGRPLAGLVAAGFLALHPLHLRFCLEARGYSLMLLFFVLTLWAICRALRLGRKRDWVAVGVAQFLVMYSWKGGLYPLLFVNAVVGLRLLLGPVPGPWVRRRALARWLAAGLIGTMAFIPLTASSQLQIRKSIGETRKRAKPMDVVWRDNLVSETLLGVPWHETEAGSPREASVARWRQFSPWVLPAVAVVCLLPLAGLGRLWFQDRFLAWMCVAVLASGVAAALHFKFVLRVELLTWYLVYQVPVLALLFAVAVTPGPPELESKLEAERATPGLRHHGLGWAVFSAVGLGALALVAAPGTAALRQYPREDFKQAALAMRGAHEPGGYAGPSNIYTGWLWRHAATYDPRGDTYVRSKAILQEKCRLARERGGEFYMVVGMRALSEGVYPEIMQILRDPRQFDHLATFWGGEGINTLDLYRMRP